MNSLELGELDPKVKRNSTLSECIMGSTEGVSGDIEPEMFIEWTFQCLSFCGLGKITGTVQWDIKAKEQVELRSRSRTH